MIEIIVDGKLLDKAKNHYEYMNRMLNQWSFHNGSGNMVGSLGECAVKQYYGDVMEFPKVWSPNYDITWDNKWKIDVKSKAISAGIEPKDHFNVSVSTNNGGAMGTTQQCDIYCFCHVSLDYKKVWIDGFLTKEKFLKTAKFFKKGSLDTDNPHTKFHFKVDTYVTQISNLQFPKYV
jgi:hypothetical protein